MIGETVLLPTQPTTHISQCHWRQYLACEDYSLNTEQLHRFYALKKQANVLFEPPNQRWDLLKTLYSQYFNTEVKLEGKQWMKLGFQGSYPQTDLRGGGIISLQLIIKFVRSRKQLVKTMQQDKGGFFFAITAINIAFFMKKYFHLADFLQVGRDVADYCNRRALKNFCRILAVSESFFHDMHSILLEFFYKKIWLKAQEIHQTNTLLQFNALFEHFIKKIRQAFEGYTINTPKEFLEIWDQLNRL